MPYVAPSSRATGYLVTAANWNQDVVDNVAFLANPPSVRATSTATTLIATAAWTALAFAAEDYDTDTMHDNVTNNSRITIKTAGLYVVAAASGFAGNVTGDRALGIRKNGAGAGGPSFGGELKSPCLAAGDPWYGGVTVLAKFAVNDYLEVVTFQNTVGNLALNATDGNQWFAATWVGLG